MRRQSIARGLVSLCVITMMTVGCGGTDEPVNTATGTAAGPIAWTRTFGGNGDQAGWVVATTETGEIVVAGTMQGRVDFGTGGQIDSVSESDIFVAWINRDGKVARVRRFGETGGHDPRGITIDSSGGVILTGVMFGSIDFGGGLLDTQGSRETFLASFGADGNYRFALRAGNVVQQSSAQLAVAGDGSILWSGSFDGDIDIGGIPLKSAGQTDVFVAKVSAAGKATWAHALGGSGTDTDMSIALLPQDRILVSGNYQGAPNLGDGALPNANVGQFLAAFEPDGKLSWSRGFAYENGYFAFSVHVDEAGSPWLMGSCGGEIDVFGSQLSVADQGVALVKLNIDGVPLSTQVFVADQPGFIRATRARGGGFVIAGDFAKTIDLAGQSLTSAGGSDVFVVWVDSEGRVTRRTRAGGAGDEWFGGISMLSTGQVVVTGAFDGTMNVGGAAFTSVDGPDSYVLLLN